MGQDNDWVADSAWLRMERRESPMVVHGFFEFADAVSADQIRTVLESRLLPEPRFSQRVAKHRMPLRRPQWMNSWSGARHAGT